MRIIIFTEGYRNGGVDTFILNLIKNWPEVKDEFVFFGNITHPAFSGPRAYLFNALEVTDKIQVRCHDIPTLDEIFDGGVNNCSRKSKILIALTKLLLKYLYLIIIFFKLKGIFLSEKFDRLIVVNGGHPGGDTCRAAVVAWRFWKSTKPKAIYNFHNLAVRPKWYVAIIEYFIDRMVSNSSKHIVSVSKACLDSLLVRPGFNDSKKWRIVYNGIEKPKKFNIPISINFKKSFNFPENSFVLLMLATYEKRKGHQFIIEVLQHISKELSNVFLLICGDGTNEEIENVRNTVSNAKLTEKVRLEKFHIDVNFLIQNADILVVPSQTSESFGLVIIEAMSLGVPVVATNVGGIPEVIIDGESGCCVDRLDAEKFSNIVIQLIQDTNLYNKYKTLGKKRFANNFTAKKMAFQYKRLI